MAGKLRNAHQSGEITANAVERQVKITWVASALENQPPDNNLEWDLAARARGNAKIASALQIFNTAFHPTAFGKISDSQFLVCGVKAAGLTIIQKWTLSWPQMRVLCRTRRLVLTQCPLCFRRYRRQLFTPVPQVLAQ